MPKEREDANGHLIFYYDDSESDEEDLLDDDEDGDGATTGEMTPGYYNQAGGAGGVALAFTTKKGDTDFKDAFENLRERFAGDGVLDTKQGSHYYKKSCKGVVYFNSSDAAMSVKIEFGGKKCAWDDEDVWEVVYHFD